MRLSQLLQDCYLLPVEADREISGLTLDSRQVKSQGLFLAVKGAQLDGRDYVRDAVSRGAAAILADADEEDLPVAWQADIPFIPVFQLRKQLGGLAARFYQYPAEKMRMIGVTGTSGKTSCTHFIAQSLQSLDISCGIIGTLGCGFYGALGTAGLTTPDAVTLQATLAQFSDCHAHAIAMEVSSHSIDQERIRPVAFDLGIFTNLSQDHLDYHGDMETYAAVKRRFLADRSTKHLIISADDAYGRAWINELASQKPVVAYGLRRHLSIPADIPFVYAARADLTPEGIRAEVRTPWGEGELLLPLMGQFNLSNALAVLASLCVYGISLEQTLACLSRLQTVPGRMQTLGGPGQPRIIVDYAHKPDALEKVLQALRAHTEGKLWCVFGCGGERDRGKRPLMAKIAEEWADQVIVTNDNPRHENPGEIVAEIMRGFLHPERVFIEMDRSKAIQNSIQWATAKDCVLIAGKGAERYQQIGDEKIPFDDVEQVKACLAKD
ncbi:UDP-N-acetylmuramoyl-L-alanyl-D-glutamate--2, 6-diaminopimelate ligase [Aquicella siphonis]|uniref:UDP-N-acetylmuramoyl-L-alanyl-D-glutamate--2,6-diaminopimelate ligase n=1 Tax=Aquicella siphonis TaxID=254247 RepID=A0A5E4PIR9_9COXI|nr:UDP-N-acetylmuramoyl-L-alanyl-D-glutamate--2,6-diaminopimelate ligase [Aquicella siphonis]VVC76348.1 UDP-N-acetylmuramoyl-L-alanyl-D-glutamate--2, 6-diaminopimelate ligase [Aquicella siphonis]